MDSFESLDLIRIKKEKEKAEGASTEKDKKALVGKIAEPEIVKTLVPIKVGINDAIGEKDKALRVFYLLKEWFF